VLDGALPLCLARYLLTLDAYGGTWDPRQVDVLTIWVFDGSGNELLSHKGGDRYGVGPEHAVNFANPKPLKISLPFTATDADTKIQFYSVGCNDLDNIAVTEYVPLRPLQPAVLHTHTHTHTHAHTHPCHARARPSTATLRHACLPARRFIVIVIIGIAR